MIEERVIHCCSLIANHLDENISEITGVQPNKTYASTRHNTGNGHSLTKGQLCV